MPVDNYVREKDNGLTRSKFGPMLIQKTLSQTIQFTHCQGSRGNAVATNRKIAGSVLDNVIAFFFVLILSGTLWPGGLTEMSTRNISLGVKAAGLQDLQPCHVHIQKSWRPRGLCRPVQDSFTQLHRLGLKPTNYLLTTAYVQYPLQKFILIRLVEFQDEI